MTETGKRVLGLLVATLDREPAAANALRDVLLEQGEQEAADRLDLMLGLAGKVELIRNVYDLATAWTESLEDDYLLGPDFAYFVGAVIKDTYCGWPEKRPFIRLLRANFPAEHSVWNFIQIEEEEDRPTIV